MVQLPGLSGRLAQQCFSLDFSALPGLSFLFYLLLPSDTVIQQVPPEGRAGQANIDPSTSLTPKHNEKFLNDRLFKRKTARVSKNKGDKGKGKEEEKPFLLFDPLLDKPKKTKAAKPLTRSEMEERMRFRKSGKHSL